jgi:pSer/pThr/pTyr-binding forkhead associated (FHA) protein
MSFGSRPRRTSAKSQADPRYPTPPRLEYSPQPVPTFALQIGPQWVRLQPGLHRVGRDPLCEIQLTDESVSRRHATVRVDAKEARIADDASRNGVRVNGERVTSPRVLLDGDRVQVGTVEMQFVVEEGETPLAENAFGAGTRPLPKSTAKVDALAILSPRERDVLARLARGEAHRDIAEALDVSIKTVETYRARIGEKLQVKGRADLVRIALEAGLLRAP